MPRLVAGNVATTAIGSLVRSGKSARARARKRTFDVCPPTVEFLFVRLLDVRPVANGLNDILEHLLYPGALHRACAASCGGPRAA